MIAEGEWTAARRAIQRELRRSPANHWLLSRLALTYYEQYRYAEALELDQRALGLEPDCPLALWGLAGSLDMLDRNLEAADVYKQIIRYGIHDLATGKCGEGVKWARGLVADAWYRLGKIHQAAGSNRHAARAFKNHLTSRRGGSSIYEAAEARRLLRSLAKESSR